MPRLPDNDPNSLLTLSDHADLSVLNTVSPSADSYQSSRAYLAATWTVTTLQGLEPVRYEVSAGRSSETSPLGVFDLLEDRVWRDVGLETSSVISVPAGQSQVLCHCRFHRSVTVPGYFYRSVAVLCHCRSSLLFPQITQSSVSLSLPQVSHSSLLFTEVSHSCVSVSLSLFSVIVVPTGQSQFSVIVVPTGQSLFSVMSFPHVGYKRVIVVPTALSFPQINHSCVIVVPTGQSQFSVIPKDQTQLCHCRSHRSVTDNADKSVVFVMTMLLAKFCAR